MARAVLAQLAGAVPSSARWALASRRRRVDTHGPTTPRRGGAANAFRRFADDGFAACAIEASSIGSPGSASPATAIAVALFTNFTLDHLDHHGTMEAYWAAKARLFDWPGLRSAVVNLDDERGAALAASLADRALDLWTVSIRQPAAVRASAVGYRDGGLAFDVAEAGGAPQPVRTGLIGQFNVANLLGRRRAALRWACRSPMRRASARRLTRCRAHATRRSASGDGPRWWSTTRIRPTRWRRR